MQTRTTALLTAAILVVALVVWLLPPSDGPPTTVDHVDAAAARMPPAEIATTARVEIVKPSPTTDTTLTADDDPTTTVSIRLFDRRNGAPIASAAEMWQLDMAADDRWTAGDRHALDCSIGEQGAEFELAAGRYRLAVACQPVTSVDPPAFIVGAKPLHLEWPVDLPHTIELWLQVFDEHGQPIESGRLGTSFELLNAAPPPWANARSDKSAPTPMSHGGAGSAGSHPRTADPARGFPLGRWRERLRGQPRATRKWLRLPDHAPVKVDLANYVATREPGPAPRRTYVGVAVPDRYFHDAVLVPDGRTAHTAGARFHVTSEALVRAPGSFPDLWRWAPITVTVRLQGYRDLRFEHRLVDGHPPIRVMATK